MPITETKRTVYSASCPDCGQTWAPKLRKPLAESDLRRHECGVHRESPGSQTYRWWTNDVLRLCICGKSYGAPDSVQPFHCPASE